MLIGVMICGSAYILHGYKKEKRGKVGRKGEGNKRMLDMKWEDQLEHTENREANRKEENTQETGDKEKNIPG